LCFELSCMKCAFYFLSRYHTFSTVLIIDCSFAFRLLNLGSSPLTWN
jgi:hypothetical protein